MSEHPDPIAAPRVAVLGTKAIAMKLVERLNAAGIRPVRLVTWDDSDDVRSRMSDLHALSQRLSIPFTAARRSKEAYAAISASAPALVLVAGWYQLVPDEVLEVAEHGFIGAHYSPLPRYRGSAPVVWQLINGEIEVGFSLFRLGPGMDEGEIASSGFIPTGDGYVADVLDMLDDAALDELVRIAPNLADGTHAFTPQPSIRPSYTSRRRPADGHIDWTRAAGDIVRSIRAQSRPYPGAWSMSGEAKIRIWRATVEESADYYGIPGQVIRIIDNAPVVACGGNGGVRLDEFDGPQIGLANKLS